MRRGSGSPCGGVGGYSKGVLFYPLFLIAVFFYSPPAAAQLQGGYVWDGDNHQ